MANAAPMGHTMTAPADRRQPERAVVRSELGARCPRAGRGGRRRRARRDLRPVRVVRVRPRAACDRRRPGGRGREPGRVRRVVGATGGVRPRTGQPAHLARHAHAPASGRLRAPRGGAAPPRRARREPRRQPRPTSRRWRPRWSPPNACAPRSTCCRPTSGAPSSSRTSAGRPTVRSRKCSASRRAPPSRGLRLGLRRIADALEAEGDEW